MQTHNSRARRCVLFWSREQKNEFYGCQRRSESCTNVVPFEGVSISYWMDSSCLRSITMFTGYFSTVTKKICWFTLKLNRSLKPYHVEIMLKSVRHWLGRLGKVWNTLTQFFSVAWIYSGWWTSGDPREMERDGRQEKKRRNVGGTVERNGK